jgi:hypothetical protein
MSIKKEPCFFYAVGKCRFNDEKCRGSHDPDAVFAYLDSIVCQRMVAERSCPGCPQHHSVDVVRAYIRLSKAATRKTGVMSEAVERKDSTVKVTVTLKNADGKDGGAADVDAAVGVKFPTAADMVMPDAVNIMSESVKKTVIEEPTVEELIARFQEELRPKGDELDELRKQLREHPYWPGQVYVMVDFMDNKINTPAILERCLQQIREDIGLPCYVSVVRMGDHLGISVKHPKIFVNR